MAASQQMAATAETLRSCHRSPIVLVDRTKKAQIAQSYLSKTPLHSDAVALLDDERAELETRAALAGDLARLAALFADITNSSAASDASKAAADLNGELNTMKPLAGGAREEEGLKVAVSALANVIKAQDEVRAAKLIKPVATSISAFFDKEADQCLSFRTAFISPLRRTATSSSSGSRSQTACCTAPRYSRLDWPRRLPTRT